MTHRILILGGTTEARQLAGKLAARADVALTLSLAGRTENPVAQGVPVAAVGGFGGARRAGGVSSRQPASICWSTPRIPMRRKSRPMPRQRRMGPVCRSSRSGAQAGSRPKATAGRWSTALPARSTALGPAPRRVFLALGRQEVAAFEAAPQHHYLIRSVDPVEPRLAVPDATYLLARGPFREADERALLLEHRIDVVVSKNSGGEATYGKIAAARALGIEVVMVRRPTLPDVASAETVEALAAMVDHLLVGHFPGPAAERGV